MFFWRTHHMNFSELRCCVLVGQKHGERGGKSCSLLNAVTYCKLEEWNENFSLVI
jgi:hypothetical protein